MKKYETDIFINDAIKFLFVSIYLCTKSYV